MVHYLLLPFQPQSHLIELVLLICSLVHLFCEVNMQVLHSFCVVIVSAPEILDGSLIMAEHMHLWEVELGSDSSTIVEESLFLGMECPKVAYKASEGHGCLRRVLRYIEEIQHLAYSTDD